MPLPRFALAPLRALTLVALLAPALACGSGGLFSIFGDDDDEGSDGAGRGTDGGAFGAGGLTGGSGGGTANGDGGCSPDLTGIVRDFRAAGQPGGHPDFESFLGDGQKRMVLPQLGADEKPAYNPQLQHQFVTSPESFAQWYRDVPGTNQRIPFVLPLTVGANGVASYENLEFFPIDGRGFGNSGDDEQGRKRNFHFTFELHTEFEYRGGEVFTFTGDDDLWTFVNGRLAIDLGGLHSSQTATLDLDAQAEALGLAKGKTYPLAVFHAERHTTASRFRIDTTIRFTNCNPILR